MFSRSVIGNARFDEGKTYGEDFLFLLKVFPEIRKAVLVPEILYHYFSSRPGNVVSAELDDRSKEMLHNAQYAYTVLSNRGYPDLAIHRLLVAISEVSAKFDYTKKIRKEYYDYLQIINDLIQKLRRDEVNAFLQSNYYPLREKIKLIALHTSPAIFLASHKIKTWKEKRA